MPSYPKAIIWWRSRTWLRVKKDIPVGYHWKAEPLNKINANPFIIESRLHRKRKSVLHTPALQSSSWPNIRKSLIRPFWNKVNLKSAKISTQKSICTQCPKSFQTKRFVVRTCAELGVGITVLWIVKGISETKTILIFLIFYFSPYGTT